MNTRQICRQLSVTPKMLRVYEEGGLIRPRRGENNYREYSESDALRIRMIAMLRKLGFSVKEIRRIFQEKQDDVESMLYAFYVQLKAIEMQRQQLKQNRQNITAAINRMLAGASPMDSLYEQETASMYDTIRDQWNFDEMAENYVARFLQEDSEYQEGIGQARQFLRKLPKDSRILDAGGGTCYLWKELRGFSQVTILDNSLPMLLYARQTFAAQRYLLQDVLDVPTQQGEYDVVISTFLLHHLNYAEQQLALKNLLAMLKPEGILYIVDRFFQSADEKQRWKQLYEETGDQRGMQEISTEYFPLAGELEEALWREGYSVTVQRKGRFVRCFQASAAGRSCPPG